MTWKLFLDDERFPVDDTWTIARTVPEALNLLKTKGLPSHMSLDHDLGENQETGYDFVKKCANYCIDLNIQFSPDFYVHSQNPIGKQNMDFYWANYQEYYMED